MTELHLALSIEAMQAMAHGQELVLDMEDEGTRVFLRCDDAAINTFRQQVEKALLHMLPANPTPH